MKFHINNEFIVHTCNAKQEENCPFFGKNGGTNHYENQTEATRAAEKLLSQKHTRKTINSTAFQKQKDIIRNAMIEYNIAKRLKNVSNTHEMVKEWFDNDRKKYNAFKELVNNQEISKETKSSIATFIMKGVNYHQNKSVYDISEHGTDGNIDFSDVTILEEFPEKVDLDNVRGIDFSFFNK